MCVCQRYCLCLCHFPHPHRNESLECFLLKSKKQKKSPGICRAFLLLALFVLRWKRLVTNGCCSSFWSVWFHSGRCSSILVRSGCNLKRILIFVLFIFCAEFIFIDCKQVHYMRTELTSVDGLCDWDCEINDAIVSSIPSLCAQFPGPLWLQL